MSKGYSAGFTIIELILFLAISSALAMGILASSQVAINNQRYRDTLVGVQNQISKQYTQVNHVVNLRDDDSDIAECDGSRGASNCTILGRLLQITDEEIVSSTLVAKPIVDVAGTEDANGIPAAVEDGASSTDSPANEEEYFGLYNFYVAGESVESYSVPWQKKISNIEDDSEYRVLVLRSPETGLVYTYSAKANATNADYASIITKENRSADRILCIPRDGFGISQTLGVRIKANASNSGAIEIMTDRDGLCTE